MIYQKMKYAGILGLTHRCVVSSNAASVLPKSIIIIETHI